MRSFSKLAFTSALILTLAISMTACGGGGGGGGNNGGGLVPLMKVTSQSVNSDPTSTIGLDCNTDIHVNYYSTQTPSAGTAGNWFVDWHESARDIDGDGIVDVELDINPTQVDSVFNGLKQFSAYKLPAGYYVISINNYSCPTTVSNTVNVKIGDATSGPYYCLYTAFDYEGTPPAAGDIPGAWCRVTDVVVTSSSTTVKPPDYALQPWHDGAFGWPMTAPAMLKSHGIK